MPGVWKFLSEEGRAEIEAAVAAAAAGEGREIVEIAFGEEGGTPALTVFLWKKEGISLDDCEEVHGKVSDALDALERLFPRDYILNVSSSGLDRPVVTDDDFRRSEGTVLEVVDGKAKCHGRLVAYDSETFTLELEGKRAGKQVFDRSANIKVQPYITF